MLWANWYLLNFLVFMLQI
uniref:Uncharacterized protein n=1 Tax=Rhizophora mucronata TaxID=61149 RepID=A0A2P2QIA6_RHIMU